jgi:DNA-binding transcriptional regulator YiaG
MIAGLPFHATCRIKDSMNQTVRDSKEKRQRIKQLAQTQKLKTGRAFAAEVRRSNIHPSVHKLTAWRKRNRLSQRAAVAVLQKYYFHLTFASLRSWEEGRRSPHPHTAAILEKFLNDHPTVPPPEMSQPTSIQMLDTAIWKELGVEEVTESEAFYHALATLLSRWLLARSEYPEMEAIKLFAKVRAYVAQPERFL